MAPEPRIIQTPDEAAVIRHLCELVEAKAKEVLAGNPSFHLGLSGGSLIKFLCQGLPSITTEWEKWKVFFCDERLVPEDSDDSTWGAYKTSLLPLTGLKEEQFLRVRTDLTCQQAAADYQDQLTASLGSPPRLDLLLLGAGPDGHTCSLFPGHQLLMEPAPPTGRLVAPITDSPKPPPERVTLTMPVVNSAGCCIFAATGAGKAAMMKQLLGPLQPEETPLPARMVRPENGEVMWILDSAAAAQL